MARARRAQSTRRLKTRDERTMGRAPYQTLERRTPVGGPSVASTRLL
jgi:hypothetical protein